MCIQCRNIKTETEFYKTACTKDGLRGQCKECLSKNKKKYRLENKDKLSEYTKKNAERFRPYKHEWYLKNKERMSANSKRRYRKQNQSNFKYTQGISNPNTHTGLGIISEYIVSLTLGDCKSVNNKEDFHLPYDLISEEYGRIDVKSSKLMTNKRQSFRSWKFNKSAGTETPDIYACLGFNEDRTRILRVWIVPGNSDLVTKTGISLSYNQTERAKIYEVDSEPYNKVYENLNIYELPEFCNIAKKNI